MASEPRKRGAFIVLEGLDRSGKTTQVKLLEQRFIEAGRPAKTMRFPDRSTVIGKMIDGYLKSDVEVEDHVIHLLFSANRKSIERLLNEGTTIVCDRYYHSGIVYSYAKSNPSMPLSWLTAPESGLPRPDAVLFLDLTPEEARARGGWGNEIYEKEEMQKKVGEAFRQLGGVVDGGEIERDEDVVVVDAGGSVEDVSEKIWSVVAGALNAVERGEKGGVRTVP